MPLLFRAGFYYAGPNLDKVKTTFDAEVIAYPEIHGVTIRLPWRRLEPVLGVYDWTTIETIIDACVRQGKKIGLMILCGEEMPEWGRPMIAHSAFHLDRGGGEYRDVVVPHPWDPAYQQFVVAAHRAALDFLNQKGALGLLAYIRFAIMGMGGELALPRPRGGGDQNDPIIREWLRPGVDFRPSKVRAGYMAMARPIALMAPPQVLFVQGILEAAGFPEIDDDGNFGVESTLKRDIFQAMLADPAFQGRVGVGDQSLMPESTRPLERGQNEIAALGAERVFQTKRGPEGAGATPAIFLEALRTGLKHGNIVEVFDDDAKRYQTALALAWSERLAQENSAEPAPSPAPVLPAPAPSPVPPVPRPPQPAPVPPRPPAPRRRPRWFWELFE